MFLREINWHQFETQFLANGLVEKVIVTNKTTAKVVLKPDVSVTIQPASAESIFGWTADPSAGANSGTSTPAIDTSSMNIFERIQALRQQQAEQVRQQAFTNLSPFEERSTPPTPPQSMTGGPSAAGAAPSANDALAAAIRREDNKSSTTGHSLVQPQQQASFYFNIGYVSNCFDVCF